MTRCTGYADRRQPSEETAWVLRSDPRRNEIGFVRASTLKPAERYVLGDDWD